MTTDQHVGGCPSEKETEMTMNTSLVEAIDPFAMSLLQRKSIYLFATQCEKKKQEKEAEVCYLKCIQGLSSNSEFEELPKCLHALANLYSQQGDFEKALPFVQAEKMFYENAIIDSQKHNEKNTLGLAESNESTVEEENSNAAKRAQEFEMLSKLCRDENKPSLALEYAAKALKLKKDAFGEDALRSPEHIQIFTCAYADVGKKAYMESMQKYLNIPKEEREAIESPDIDDGALPLQTFLFRVAVSIFVLIGSLVIVWKCFCWYSRDICQEVSDELYFIDLRLRFLLFSLKEHLVLS
eukprot:Nk52_evm48s215 gene=Nk52_evmTU48s215